MKLLLVYLLTDLNQIDSAASCGATIELHTGKFANSSLKVIANTN